MNIRHVIDESGLRLGGFRGEAAREIVDAFLQRLDVASDREECVARTSELYNAPVTDEHELFEVLFEAETSPIDDVDLRRRLQRAIDRAQIWDDDPELFARISAVDVKVDAEEVYAPALAFAHSCRDIPRTIGCLNFRSSGREGTLAVEAGGNTHELHFVIDEASHRQVFRDAVEIENMTKSEFSDNASSAFPDLLWADNLWSELGEFKRPYRELRSTIVRHLAVLADVGADIFDELMSTRPEEIGPRLDVRGVPASDENGRTKQDKQARLDRTRHFDGEELVFWWHTKLLPDTDRIHFLWRPGVEEERGVIIIGIFTDHCHLPK